ncbi:4'-phosphopantetheinyl transferase superfamily protein [Nguyenibacter vanlangensis]|uniref:4'-phosphopantetheinyl transferase superfamily protein n=1 Tax=Nguyenibacter vanlangensis TaxID=1216886 RepID=A0ABZ3D2I3_9PROT
MIPVQEWQIEVPFAALRPRLFSIDARQTSDQDALIFAETLSEEERLRRDALRYQDERRLFELAHGLMRSAAATCLGVPLDHVLIESRVGRKPRVVWPVSKLDISMAHARHSAVCAVFENGDVGVDAEFLREGRTRNCAWLLSPEEQAWLKLQPPGTAREISIWTLKEAVAKALGVGMRLDFSAFSIRTQPPGMIRAPAGYDGRWTLWQSNRDRMQVALAWRTQE